MANGDVIFSSKNIWTKREISMQLTSETFKEWEELDDPCFDNGKVVDECAKEMDKFGLEKDPGKDWWRWKNRNRNRTIC